MVTTLATKTLYLDGLDEPFEMIGAQWDAWEGGVYKKKIRVLGIVKKWTLRCHEKGVAWDDSAAKYFEQLEEAGTTVVLVIDQGSVGAGKLHNVPATNVKILSVIVTYDTETSGADYREFVVTVQAV